MATLPGPLGAAVRDIIKLAPRLLPQAEAAQHQGRDALDAAEFERLAESFVTVRRAVRGAAQDTQQKVLALVSDGNFASALITCAAIGADWLCKLRQVSGSQRMVAFEALTAVSCLTHALDQPIPSSASAVAFVRTLLRTHTLERLSRACAAATACVQEHCVAITEAGAAVAAPWEGYLFDCQRTLGAVASLIPRLTAVGQRAAAVPVPAPPPPFSAADRDGYSARQREWKRLEVAKRVLVSELVSHLATSGALEMMARAQLTVGIATSAALEAEDRDTARELQNVGMTNLHLYLQVLTGVVALCRAVSPDAAATLVAAMSGPCFRHLVLSAALAALCAADDGPCYGLPDALIDGLPVMGSAREAPNRLVRDVRSLQDQGVAVWLGPSIFGSVVTYLHLTALQITVVAGAPRMLLEVLLRMGSLAVESARTWADADAAAEADDEGRLLLDPDRSEEAVALVCDCLF